MAPSLAQVPAPVELPRVTKRAPLKSSGNLDQFERFDVTSVIGTEFARGVQVSGLLSAPNSDDLIRDLAILGIFSRWNTADTSVATRGSVLPGSRYHSKTAGAASY
jgi:hypothetical protein